MKRQLIFYVLACTVVSFPQSFAFGGCRDIYTDAQVTAMLSKSEYADCDFDVMKADYVAILQEEVRLLSLTRTAYKQHLEQNAHDDLPVQARLHEYDTKLENLSYIATVLPTTTAGLPNNAETAELREAGSSLRGLLREGKEHSQVLNSKVEPIREGLQGEETVPYCKLDFYVRILNGLHSKTRDCF